jgi:hypothetical protein
MINLKAGDKAVHATYGGYGTTYKIVTVARETKTQLVIESGKKFAKKDGLEAVAYSAWHNRDKLFELTPEMQGKVDEHNEQIYRRGIIRAIEGAKFDKLPTDVLEAIKEMVDNHSK